VQQRSGGNSLRNAGLLTICLLAALSGCATRWTVFGHSMGGTASDGDAKPTVAAPASATQSVATTAPQPGGPSTGWKAKAVEVTFTASGRAKLATDPRFNQDDLLTAIVSELRAHALLDESNPGTGERLGIVIDDFASRPATNAVVFGYILSTGTLQGEVVRLASDGEALQSSKVRVRVHLTDPAGSGRADFFRPLYRGFAELTVRKLTGAAEPVGVNH
jgi:hypothetical protein